MKSRQVLTLAALMILGFAATIAVVWIRTPSAVHPLLPAAASAAPGRARFASRVWSPPAAAATAAPRVSAAPPPDSAAPPSDDAGLPLPVLLAVSSQPRQKGSDDVEGAGGASAGGVVRQVDVVNTSNDLLPITILAVDGLTQETTSSHVLVTPQGQAHVGAESGLKLAPGYRVALRSNGYREMTATVP